MEGFFEADRVIEASLSKLASIKSGNLLLRKTLLVSKVLNTAQNMATSVEVPLLSTPHSTRESSKLLASFGQNESTMDGVPTNVRIPKNQPRQQSPIAKEEYHETAKADEESMDFENVSSILSEILNDCDSEMADSQEHTAIDSKRKTSEDVSNLVSDESWSNSSDTTNHSCWGSEFTVLTSRPTSPGKRNYQQAFPFDAQNSQSQSKETFDDLKRFKSSSSRLDSLPGFCGYLSTKNLQTAPFITYMFGNGFTHPGNPDLAGDWPNRYSEHMEERQTPLTTPILAF